MRRCWRQTAGRREIYGTTQISERHRHRYEINIGYKDTLEQAGLLFLGHVARRHCCPKSSSFPIIPGSSACSSIPSSNRSRSSRTRCSARSCRAALDQSRLV